MPFKVSADILSNRLIITLAGFATIADVAEFSENLSDAFCSLSKSSARRQILYDVSAAAIQSQDVVSAIRKLVVHSPRASAVAIVNASALAGRQIERIFAGVPHQRCRNVAEALIWLEKEIQF